MILHLCEALDVPLRERNSWLLAGGFAPAFSSHRLDDPQMTQVLAAVERMLAGNSQVPAAVVDAEAIEGPSSGMAREPA